LTDHHDKRLSEIKKPTIRLALDHMDYRDKWKEIMGYYYKHRGSVPEFAVAI